MKLESIINSYKYHLLDLYYEDSILSKYNLLSTAYLIYKLGEYLKKNRDSKNKPIYQAGLYNGSIVYFIIKFLILIILFGYLVDISKNNSIYLLISIGLIFSYMFLNFLSYVNNTKNKKVDCEGRTKPKQNLFDTIFSTV